MKRRDFLGSLLAGATLASLPASVLASPDPIIWNAETLAAQLENMFSCRMGPPMAFCYFNGKTGEVVKAEPTETQHPRFPNQKIAGYTPPPEGYSKYDYETYVCAIEGGTAEEAEAKLAKHFYDEFSKVPSGSLVWRVKPHFESELVNEYGKTYLTQAQIEDQVWKFTDRGNGRVKFDAAAQPSLPEDVELDPNTQSYRHVKRKYMLHKMRMRLVLPESYKGDDEFAISSLARQEGTRAIRI